MKTTYKAIFTSLVASCILCGNAEARTSRFFTLKEQNEYIIKQIESAKTPAELIAAAPLIQHLPDFRKYKTLTIQEAEPIAFENLTSRQSSKSLEWFAESKGIWYPDIENFKVFEEVYFPLIDQFLRKMKAKVEIINYKAKVEYQSHDIAKIQSYDYDDYQVKNRRLIAIVRLKNPEQIMQLKHKSKVDIEITLYSIPQVFDQFGAYDTPATKGLRDGKDKNFQFCSYVVDGRGNVALKFGKPRNRASSSYFYNFSPFTKVKIITPHFINNRYGSTLFVGHENPAFCLDEENAKYSKGSKVIFATKKPDSE